MSKNTQISELINYISVNESGNVVFTTVPAASSNTDKFLVSDSGVLKFRTATQLLSDIGAQASGSYQAALSGTGFVKISGSTISYDNSTYLTTSSASSTYLPLVGGALTGGLTGTTASFSSFITAQSTGGSGLRIYGSSGTNQWDVYLNSTNLRFSDNTGTGSVVFDRPISGTTATFSSSVTAQTNLGVINANASQAGFVADYTGAGALKVSFSTYNDIMNIFNETNSYSLLNFTRSTKHLVLNPTGENVTVNTTNTGASGLSINNQHNLSFSEGSGLSYVNIFRQRNSAALVMGAGYKRSVTGAFASSFSSAMARAAIAIGYNNGSIVFFTDASSTVANGTDITPTERVTILSNGDTGFGTTNPTQKLEVKGNIRLDSRSKVDTGEIDNITFTKDRPDASTGTYEMGAIRSFTYGGYAGGLTFYSGRHTGGGSYGLIPVMTIGSTSDIGLANLGIGTTAPVGKLTVQTTGADGLVMESDLGSVNNSCRLFFKSTVQTFGLFNNSADLRFTYDAVPGNTSGTSLARFANTGKYFRMEASTGGIQFQGNTGASNALNYYEEGNWTPQLGWGSGSTYTMSGINSGRYVRIGSMVHLQFQLNWSSFSGSATSGLRVTGIPFSAGGTCRSAGSICANAGGITLGSGYTWLGLTIDPGASFIYIIQNTNNTYSHDPSVSSSGIVYSLQISYTIN